MAKIGIEHNEYITDWSLIVCDAQQCGVFWRFWSDEKRFVPFGSTVLLSLLMPISIFVFNTWTSSDLMLDLKEVCQVFPSKFSLIIIGLSQCWNIHLLVSAEMYGMLFIGIWICVHLNSQITCMKEKHASDVRAYLCETFTWCFL